MSDESAFRACLDEDGILKDDVLAPPVPAYLIFAQRSDAMLDVAALRTQAARFFATKLGLTVDKRYGPPPLVDAARIVVAGAHSGTRLAYGRPATPGDHGLAEKIEGGNMALLARRCKTVWLVEGDDAVALTIAAVFASVLLGPIIPPEKNELFGVRTARLRL